jgi:hypothetical protein
VKRIVAFGVIAIVVALLIAALAPSAHAQNSLPGGSIVGTWTVTVTYPNGVPITQKWVLGRSGTAMITPIFPWVPVFSSATWRRNSEYLGMTDDLGGPELWYRCTLRGDTFTLVPVDMSGRRLEGETYAGQRRW